MPWWKTSKTNDDQQKGQVSRIVETTERRRTVGASSSYSSTTITSFSHSLETIQSGSQSQIQNRTISGNQLPSTSSTLSQIPYRRLTTDAIPFVPNYQSPFQRSGLYNSARPISNVPAISISTNRATSGINTPTSTNRATSGINTPTSANRATSGINSWSRAPISATQSTTNSSKVVACYNTSGKNRGNVLIINIINFMDNNEDREGAELDERDACKLFKDMGFAVEKYRNLKLSEMKKKIESFKNSRALANGDISVVMIMSHGTNKDNNNIPVSGSFTQIVTYDGKFLDTEEVVAEFSAENCPGMKGKPKIFIFQCCRGDEAELKVDCIRRRRNVTKDHADMLIAFSTLPNFYSIRDPQKGSWYIQCICKVFREHAKEHHVEDLLKIVDTEMSNMHKNHVQTSTYESRGFNKQCFFNPRW
ncbi:unnamed protein product [Psylliodes chrysocephalus]|uniref:Uncharacterized protein n=1 Tax=Psylliodes chrysocephalus TaxID=3402493 RepID=A0A9P0CN59_9CUCU|nr:unnamed protein product [Psylliodes chrysocephala]